MEYFQRLIIIKVGFFLDAIVMFFSFFDGLGGIRSKETLTIVTILMIFTLRIISWINQQSLQAMEFQKKKIEIEEARQKLKITQQEREILDKIIEENKLKSNIEKDER